MSASDNRIFTRIRNPEIVSNVVSNAEDMAQRIAKSQFGDPKNFKSRFLFVSDKSVKPQNGGTINDYLIEQQYQEIQREIDPMAREDGPRVNKARKTPIFSFHPEFNVHFLVKDRIKIQRHVPHNVEMPTDFFPHGNPTASEELGDDNTKIKVMYLDPQDAAIEHHMERVQEELEKKQKVERFHENVRKRVAKMQQKKKLEEMNTKRKKSPPKFEKMKKYASKIQAKNTSRYKKAIKKQIQEKRQQQEEQEKLMQQQEAIIDAKRKDREEKLYKSRQPIPNSHVQVKNKPIVKVKSTSKKQSPRNDQENVNPHVPKLALDSVTGQVSSRKVVGTATPSILSEQTNNEEARQKKEEERYIKALRLQLISKVKERKIELPPLCSCGLNPFEDHAKLCCNNCPFYGNPALYTQMLESILHSYGVVV